MRNTFLREPFMIYLLDLKNAIVHLSNHGGIQECPQNTNWKKGKDIDPPKPFWRELKVGKETAVQKLSNKPLSIHTITGAITSKFKRRDSEDSINSLEEIEQEPWLALLQPYNKNYDESIPDKLPKLSGTFDLYIDGIRFLPETILFAKVEGRILNPLMDLGGETKSFEEVKISALPVLNSKARSPSFHFRVRLNKEKAMMNPHASLYLEIVGFEKPSQRTVLVGSTEFRLFQKAKGSPINYGGHQLAVRRGRGAAGCGVPCCTVLVRLLTAREKFVSAPSYGNGFYHSDMAGPVEAAFYKTYYQDEGFLTLSVRNNLEEVTSSDDNNDLQNFMEQTLTTDKSNDTPLIDPVKFHRLNTDLGIRLCFERIFGLPAKWERKYYQGLAELIDLRDPTVTHGRYLSQNFLMDSDTRSPIWADRCHPLSVPKSDNILVVG